MRINSVANMVGGMVHLALAPAAVPGDEELVVYIAVPNPIEIIRDILAGELDCHPSKLYVNVAAIRAQMRNIQVGLGLPTGRYGRWCAFAADRLAEWLLKPAQLRGVVQGLLALPAPAQLLALSARRLMSRTVVRR